jgi:transcriptional regulator with XRE-family HTH domain
MAKLAAVDKQAFEDIVKSLRIQNIREKAKLSLQKKKERVLAQSLTFDEVARMHGLAPRRLREFVSGKRTPQLRKTQAAMKAINENFVYDPEIKRWYPKNNN